MYTRTHPNYSPIENELLKARVKAKLFDSPIPRVGRFALKRLLGRGTHGTVYEVDDAQDGSALALKVLRHSDARGVRHFKREFRSLTHLTHDNLVKLHDLAVDDNHWYFTMELVHGATFTDYVAHALDAERDRRLRAALRGLLSGVHAIHQAGYVHGDLKPSNVLVTEAGRAVVLDFGLVTSGSNEPEPAAEAVQIAPGTPRYMAPELRFAGQESRASDAYAIGVMLSEALSFAALRTDECNVDDLGRLCAALLQPNPAARCSVGAALAWLGFPVEEESQTPRNESEPFFIGRASELAALHQAFDTLGSGRPTAVLLQGPSGIGKSALCDRLAHDLRGRATVLRGRCYERESLPYKAFDALIDDLARHLSTLPVDVLRAITPPSAAALLRLFPSLGVAEHWLDVEAGAAYPTQSELRQQAFASLKALLQELADRAPLVLIVDDLQWADLDSARLLAELLSPPAAPSLLYVGCHRDAEPEQGDFLATVLADHAAQRFQCRLERLQLEPLSEPEALALAQRLLTPQLSNEPALKRIAREAAGSPFFICELARYFSKDLDGDCTSLSLAHLLSSRVASLSAAARYALWLIVLAARPLSEIVLVRILGNTEQRERALATLAAAGIAHRNRDGAWLVSHDRLREHVTRLLPEREVAGLHRSLAQGYEATLKAEPEWLVEHWLGAGDHARAIDYAVAGAQQAAHKLAFIRAVELYRVALRLCGDSDRRSAELYPALAEALANDGRSAEAAAAYLAAVPYADADAAISLRCLALQHYLRSGHKAQGSSLLRELMHEVELPDPTSKLGLYVGLFTSYARAAAHAIGARRQRPVATGKAVQRLLVLRSVFRELSTFDPLRGALFHALFCEHAAVNGDLEAQFVALAWDTFCASFLGGSRVQQATARAQARLRTMAQQLQSPYAAATLEFVHAASALHESRVLEADAPAERAARMFRQQCTGAEWEAAVCDLVRYTALEVTGPISILCQDAPVLLRQAAERADHFTEAVLSRTMSQALLAQDQPEAALEFLRGRLSNLGNPAGDDFDFQHWFIQLNVTDCLSYLGEHRAAWELFEASWAAYSRSLFAKAQPVRFTSYYRRGRLALAIATQRSDTKLMHLACAIADELARTPQADVRAGTEWMRASIAASYGHIAEARARMQRAENIARQAGLRIPAAIFKRQRGRLHTGHQAATMIAEADAALSSYGVVNPARWAKQFECAALNVLVVESRLAKAPRQRAGGFIELDVA